MSISFYSSPKSEIAYTILDLFESEFGLPRAYAQNLVDRELAPHFEQLRESVWIYIETPYVDKVFRDSYYHYFSSKNGPYKKDCIRLSLFSQEIAMDDFQDLEKLPWLEEMYLGFIILRPTTPFVVGRSHLSPLALKENDFLCCQAIIPSSVHGVKLSSGGFPHSSQDTETITCAETTLWSVMEYFGYKYAEYKPTLPSKITSVLRNVSYERQIPSRGLNIQQMAFALKEFGFGPRIYSSKQFGDSFFPLLRMYSESGIPLIVAVQNEKIGHAFLCIGREKISGNMIDSLEPGTESDLLVKRILDEGKITLLDFSEISCQFIFIDDNRPVYQKARLETPTINYPSPTWKDCQISYFIAPLYPKIYLEAFEAKKYFKQFFFRIFRDSIPIESEIMIRFFLTSSRSFKHSVNFNVSMGGEMKSIILETSMPKFIWVGEISNRGLIKSNKANGVVILDATEANILDNKPLILGAFQDKIVTFEFPGRTLTTMEIPFPAFEIYSNYSGDY